MPARDRRPLRVSFRETLLAILPGMLVALVASVAAAQPPAQSQPPARSQPGPLFVYGISYTEDRAAVARLSTGDDGPSFEVVQSIPLGCKGAAIAHHPRLGLVYTVCKNGHGGVFRTQPDGRLEKIRDVEFHGGYCWLSFDATGRWLLGASYESGAVDVHGLDADGMPTTLADSRDMGRKMAHSVGVSPDNRFAYAGFVKEENALCQFAFDAGAGRLTSLDPATAEIPADFGPRHVVFHPTQPWVYFSGEQQLGVAGFCIGTDGRLGPPRIAAPPKVAPGKGLAGSDIVISPDGKFLFVGIRGFEDPLQAVVTYAVAGDGRAEPVCVTETDAIPWAIDITPGGDRLLVSAARPGTLTSYTIRPDGGLVKEAAVEIGKDFWDIVVAPAPAR